MSVSTTAERIHAALKDGVPADIIEATKQVRALSQKERLQLCSGQAWGQPIAARLPNSPCKAATLGLLAALSELRLPPPLQKSFYDSFDNEELAAACKESLECIDEHENSISIRLCIRNLARSPSLRLKLSGCLPALVSSLRVEDTFEVSEKTLKVAGASAAALCNICCDNALKTEAVKLGAVRSVLNSLKAKPTYLDAEDMVACVGVLVAGFPPGVTEFFACGDAPLLLECLVCAAHPPLQILAVEVLADVASSSTMFTAWLVNQTDLLSVRLAGLLEPGVEQELVDSALRLCKRLVTADGFARKIQEGQAVQALQRIAQADTTATMSGLEQLDPDGRKGVKRKDIVMSILESVLFL
eukprot:TRINITY_DN104353_c0_g1_i1.p1 TRINITY_DN104353_c0_g1~~TRINITY_DN104353_c0_g1_i1.p1  ORF type:complete len:358 (-),score=57.94 TRINITY_DN104353_c0_g1_i1:260-1333(-)